VVAAADEQDEPGEDKGTGQEVLVHRVRPLSRERRPPSPSHATQAPPPLAGCSGRVSRPVPSGCIPLLSARIKPGRGTSDDTGVRPLALCALLLAALPRAAAAREGAPVPERRHVIVFVDGKAPDPATEDDAHQVLDMPLNHLGMVPLRHYIRNGPPPDAWLEDARAVVTYLPYGDPAPDWMWPWLEEKVARHHLRVVHLGAVAPLQLKDPERLQRWLAGFGLEMTDLYAAGPMQVKVEYADPKLCAVETDPRRFVTHHGPRNVERRNKVWVTTRLRNDPTSVLHPVVTGSWGGFALDPWAMPLGTGDEDRRWTLDLFQFFKEALGLDRVPAPHPSVLNGRRMWFSQMDGDGFESLSTIRPGESCGAVMRDEVFAKYALPFTVSIIVRSLTDDIAVQQPTRLMEVAQSIFRLENVEPASHGVLHTLNWQPPPGFPYDRKKWYAGLQNYTYDETSEVTESIRFINERLLDGGRRCAVMLWTGSANPLEAPLAAARQAGCLNLNGGIFRWDAWTDSVGFVSPWARRVGAELQVYAGAPNENVYEGFFDTMPGAFAHVDQTIERCGTPRILKPADLYMHFYSAEHPARLKVIHDLIRRWTVEERTAPVFASTYVKAVNSAVDAARVLRTADGWILRDFGDCRTVRIDGEPREVDFSRSRGLLGAYRDGDSCYLHLGGPDAQVVLAEAPAPLPHVLEANCLLERGRLLPNGVAVTATAFNARLVRFAGFPPGAGLAVRIDDEETTREADPQGVLELRLPDPGTTRILIRLK